MADLTMKELVQPVLNLQKQVAVLNNTCEALKKENEALRAENEQLRAENTVLKNRVNELTNIIIKLRKRQFGTSSEKIAPGQESLFDEAEVLSIPAEVREITAEICNAQPKKKKSRVSKEQLSPNIPVREEIIDNGPQNCSVCGTTMTPVGQEYVYSYVKYIPAKLELIKVMRVAYECRTCRKNGTPNIVKSDVPKPVIPHSYASPSLLSWVLCQKYEMSMPLYRIEKELAQLGLAIPRSTLANWCIITANEYLAPIFKGLKSLLLTEPCIHADETPVQVLNTGTEKKKKKCYMWLFAAGQYGAYPAIRLFEYQPTRKSDVATEFLNGFNGYLQTDDYQGYNHAPCSQRVLCWAHARRKFVEAKDAAQEDTATLKYAETALQYIGKLFALEDKFSTMTIDERYEARLQQEKPLLEAFWAWAESVNTSREAFLPKSPLSVALRYALKNRAELESYLESGYCSLSNNLAENSIRPFTIGRKNWLFSSSAKGANASALIYSLVETCRKSGISPQAYFEYLLAHAPNENFQLNPERVEIYYPWSETIKEHCTPYPVAP